MRKRSRPTRRARTDGRAWARAGTAAFAHVVNVRSSESFTPLGPTLVRAPAGAAAAIETIAASATGAKALGLNR